jgi:hypothetical protein
MTSLGRQLRAAALFAIKEGKLSDPVLFGKLAREAFRYELHRSHFYPRMTPWGWQWKPIDWSDENDNFTYDEQAHRDEIRRGLAKRRGCLR